MSYYHQKIMRPKGFIKKFKKLYSDTSWHHGEYDLSPCTYFNEEQEEEYGAMTSFVFPQRNHPYEGRNIFYTDINLLISRNEDLLRNHYFTMKAYFEKFCHDPFEKAYFSNLQEKKNDKYYGYVKFFYSESQIQRRDQGVGDYVLP